MDGDESPKRGGLLSRLMRPIKSLMGRKRARAAKDQPRHLFSDDTPLTDDAFKLAIDTLCQDQEGRFQTQLQVISLVEFREAVGERWAKIIDKVMLIASGVIAHHIGAGNHYSRQGQDFFILLFRTCPQAEGRRRAMVIAQELGTRLLGDKFQGQDQPLALAVEVSLDQVMDAEGGFNFAAIQTAIGGTRTMLAAAAAENQRKGMKFGWSEGEPVRDEGLRRSLMPSKPLTPQEIAALPPITGGLPDTDGTRDPGPDPAWTPLELERRRRAAEPAWTELPPEHKPEPVAAPAAAPPPVIDAGPPPPTPPMPSPAAWTPRPVPASKAAAPIRPMAGRRRRPWIRR
jgi:hypothetical protein